jgi:hypothetical protein
VNGPNTASSEIGRTAFLTPVLLNNVQFAFLIRALGLSRYVQGRAKGRRRHVCKKEAEGEWGSVAGNWTRLRGRLCD